jgi:hypothetical protein
MVSVKWNFFVSQEYVAYFCEINIVIIKNIATVKNFFKELINIQIFWVIFEYF